MNCYDYIYSIINLRHYSCELYLLFSENDAMRNDLPLFNWLITRVDHAKAQLKYDIKRLHIQLDTLMLEPPLTELVCAELATISQRLVEQYVRYVQLISTEHSLKFAASTQPPVSKTLQQCYSESLLIRQQLVCNPAPQDTILLINNLIVLYQYISLKYTTGKTSAIQTLPSDPQLIGDFHALFNHDDLRSWLYALVTFGNNYNANQLDYSQLFLPWQEIHYQRALAFFAQEQFINLANALFFYKLYPDKLLQTNIHPEKMVSIRMRVALLHEYIEQLQRQLCMAALQHNLHPGIDYLFHGNELPQGIMLEVDETFNVLIQQAIKHLKVTNSSDSGQQITHERLLDLGLAYKFWFNPNRLIDAVMVLQNRLGKYMPEGPPDLHLFQHEMVALYHHLTTTECLDLYGHFANNNSRYLLYTLYSIVVGRTFTWLSPLTEEQQQAIEHVFQALHCVMESLRIELENRHVHTEPYVDNLYKNNINPGRRNRDVVARILLIYVDEPNGINQSIDSLFNDIEQSPLSG